MSNHILITGVPKASGAQPGGPVPVRLEINDFIKKEDHFSLYIQALEALYSTPDTDPLSWYQISGIHGMPFVSWNGSPGGENGYCNHRVVLFPTWHRPYLALLEQAIQKHAVAIADTYTVNKAQYQQAAQDLRQPFWDWAVNALPPAEVISNAQVTIVKPDGSRVPVDNPLLKFKFQNSKDYSTFPRPFSGWTSTVRTPTTTAPNATTNLQELQETLEDAAPELTRDTLALLTLVHTWPLFSNRATSDGGFTNSLEAIHDSIHVYIGGQNGGHMGDPAVAAFDPIFYLHHTNVDRLFSLWAAINPGVGVSDQVKNGDTLTGTTPLLPFWDAPSQMWQSNPVVPTSNVFNYTYPEFAGLENLDSQQLSTQILQKVNQLYGDPMQNLVATVPPPAAASSAPPIAAEKPETPAPAPAPAPAANPQAPEVHQDILKAPEKPAAPAAPPAAPAPAAHPAAASAAHPAAPAHAHSLHDEAQLLGLVKKAESALHKKVEEAVHKVESQVHPAAHPAPATHPAPPHPAPQTHVSLASKPAAASGTKWTARIRSNHHDVEGSFSVLLFVGDVPEDPKTWRKASTYAGADDVFLIGHETKQHCENCKGSDAPPEAPPVSIVEGYVHLNDAIKRAKLPSMDASVVTPYLQKNLHWRVKKINGEVVWVNSLEVVVIETSLSLPRGSLIPISQPKEIDSATRGRSGGSTK